MIRLSSLLKEKVSNGKVICDNCNWTWDISDGGEHPYLCHKCGNDNTPIKEVEVGPGHENDRDMVVGVAEILRMVDDMNNRKEIAEFINTPVHLLRNHDRLSAYSQNR